MEITKLHLRVTETHVLGARLKNCFVEKTSVFFFFARAQQMHKLSKLNRPKMSNAGSQCTLMRVARDNPRALRSASRYASIRVGSGRAD